MTTLNNIDNNFAALNPAVSKQQEDKGSSGLNQADFMELLVAQIENQDPTKPMDASQFMDQLTQLSTVSGIGDLNTSFNSLANKLSSDQSIQATNLVGRDVLVPGGEGILDEKGAISGSITLPQSASDVNLKVYNAQGEEVRNLQLGGYAAGEVQFQWDGFYDDGSAATAGKYSLVAEAYINSKQQAVELALDTRVDSITLNQNGTGTTLNLASGESVPLSFVQQIK